jgi:hypothetical protein
MGKRRLGLFSADIPGRAVLALGAGVLALGAVGASVLPPEPAQAASGAEPAATAGSPGFRRLNEAQYIRSIEQIFGPGITVPGRFDPPLREEGLLAIGDSQVSVSASGLEQYHLRAREIAKQVVAPERRQATLSCIPAAEDAFDQSCASAVISKYGQLLYRRPLTSAELTSTVSAVRVGTQQSKSFYEGLRLGLTRLLTSPNFIFRVERGVADPRDPATQRLDDYSLATRISFVLWDAPPDEALLEAAARGDLRDQAKLEAVVERMIAAPQFEVGVRAFFSDMFGYDRFSGLTKDQSIFPRFTSELLQNAQEQALRTIVDHLVATRGDYRDLFTTRKTFINRNLGALYDIPVTMAGMDGWAPYTFAEGDRRAGILTLPAFLMLDPTHQGRSSPTIRGKVVRELMLCQRVPDPPPNVDFALLSDINSDLHKTARQRLTIHNESPACKGCHAITDPIGLSLEHYDAIGAYRTHENDAVIDASGTFEGKAYEDAIGLAKLLRDSPTVPDCAVQRVFEYGVGRQASEGDTQWLEAAVAAFAANGYRFPDLMRSIATNPAFRRVATPEPVARHPKVALAGFLDVEKRR